MTTTELQAGYANYDFKDCKLARKGTRFYKKKAHKAMRRDWRKEMKTLNNDE